MGGVPAKRDLHFHLSDIYSRTATGSKCWYFGFLAFFSEGPKGGRRKGGRGRKLSHFSFCCAFRCCVVYSPCFRVWGEEKVMTIYDADPLAAGPLCGLLIFLIFELSTEKRAFAKAAFDTLQ